MKKKLVLILLLISIILIIFFLLFNKYAFVINENWLVKLPVEDKQIYHYSQASFLVMVLDIAF